jgi:hypothetical protein
MKRVAGYVIFFTINLRREAYFCEMGRKELLKIVFNEWEDVASFVKLQHRLFIVTVSSDLDLFFLHLICTSCHNFLRL